MAPMRTKIIRVTFSSQVIHGDKVDTIKITDGEGSEECIAACNDCDKLLIVNGVKLVCNLLGIAMLMDPIDSESVDIAL